MRLAELLDGVHVVKLFSLMYGKMVLTQDVTIRSVQYDSRLVERSDLFVALRGTAVDGHAFVGDAIARGAVVVVLEDDTAMPDAFFMHANVMKIVVPDSRAALATIAGNFAGHPSNALTLVGVTGTNGKTTTTYLIRSILDTMGEPTGLIGTIDYRIGQEVVPATHTTPESLELNLLFKRMREHGCSAAVMEVSSHSLAMRRVYGLKFRAGVFTNLTQDHLDFHGTMDSYFAAKKVLFDMLPPDGVAVVNVDDPAGARIASSGAARILTYGSAEGADVRAEAVDVRLDGITLDAGVEGRTIRIQSPLSGRFNVSNLLAAFATGTALGVPAEKIVAGLGSLRAVPGRFEQLPSPRGWMAIVDYAHTPDALERCLHAIRDLLPSQGRSRVITVFGCGGNRDRGKRPIMGRIASTLSDLTIVTSDNPRREDPGAIIAEIMTGVVPGRNVRTEPDRRAAIRSALGEAQRGDVVLVAGKGHEDYQVVGDTKHHFDDREEIRSYIHESA